MLNLLVMYITVRISSSICPNPILGSHFNLNKSQYISSVQESGSSNLSTTEKELLEKSGEVGLADIDEETLIPGVKYWVSDSLTNPITKRRPPIWGPWGGPDGDLTVGGWMSGPNDSKNK